MPLNLPWSKLRNIAKEFEDRDLFSLCVEYEHKAQHAPNGATIHIINNNRNNWEITKFKLEEGAYKVKTLGELKKVNRRTYRTLIESIFALRELLHQKI